MFHAMLSLRFESTKKFMWYILNNVKYDQRQGEVRGGIVLFKAYNEHKRYQEEE